MVAVNLAVNQPGTQLGAYLDSLASSITALTDRVTFLETRVSVAESTIVTHSAQIIALQNQVANLTDRVNTLSTQTVWPGPYVGTTVHLKNKDGDCTEAIIYEDPTKRNAPGTISVVYIDPDNPCWHHRRDVRQDLGLVADVPFNSWHIPENFYVAGAPLNASRRR